VIERWNSGNTKVQMCHIVSFTHILIDECEKKNVFWLVSGPY
jgi:hypothetical protein